MLLKKSKLNVNKTIFGNYINMRFKNSNVVGVLKFGYEAL